MGKPKSMTLESIHDGAAGEMFERALVEVLENVTDPNTDHKAKRSIRIEFTFVSTEDRKELVTAISCATKLAGMKGVSTLAFVGKHQGRLLAVEQPRQEDLFPQPKGRNVTEFPGGDKED